MTADSIGGVIALSLAVITAIACVGATLFFASDLLEHWLNTGDDRAAPHRDELIP